MFEMGSLAKVPSKVPSREFKDGKTGHVINSGDSKIK
jgi:hypothetical protein